ncbi:MAG: hypothetical protein HZB42_15635 [Sphingobacteriales bacterium]|nr:hypothetical protein [Sphingobacteriales bacterium]
MVYIVSAFILLLCIGVSIFAYRIYQENRKLGPQKNKYLEDDEDLWAP